MNKRSDKKDFYAYSLLLKQMLRRHVDKFDPKLNHAILHKLVNLGLNAYCFQRQKEIQQILKKSEIYVNLLRIFPLVIIMLLSN